GAHRPRRRAGAAAGPRAADLGGADASGFTRRAAAGQPDAPALRPHGPVIAAGRPGRLDRAGRGPQLPRPSLVLPPPHAAAATLAVGARIEDRGWRIAVAAGGRRAPRTLRSILDPRSSILDPQSSILDPRQTVHFRASTTI